MQKVLLSQIGLKISQENDILIIRQSNLWRFAGMFIAVLVFFLIANYLDDPSIKMPPFLFILFMTIPFINGNAATTTLTIDRQKQRIIEHKARAVFFMSYQKEYDLTDTTVKLERSIRGGGSGVVISPDGKNAIIMKLSFKKAQKIQGIINGFLAFYSKD